MNEIILFLETLYFLLICNCISTIILISSAVPRPVSSMMADDNGVMNLMVKICLFNNLIKGTWLCDKSTSW